MNTLQKLTQAQIIGALGWVVVAIGVLAKVTKDWADVVAAVRRGWKGVGMVWKWIMGAAIRRKEINDKLDLIVHELSYNHESSTKDAVKRIEQKLGRAIEGIEANAIRMNISETTNERMVFKCDAQGECVEMGEVFLKKFGYVEDDVLGFAYELIVHEDDVREMQIKWQRAISTKGKFIDEQRIRNSAGEWIKCCVKAKPILIDEHLKGFIGHIEILK